jgi:hypothetical protein
MGNTGGIDGAVQQAQQASGQAGIAAAEQFVHATAAPSTNTPLADLRWEGMSNDQLASAVQQLNSGAGGAAMTTAADALANVAADLSQINQTLQTQLQAIGVNWQSQSASDLADQMIGASAAYGGTVTDQGGQSSTAINQQAEAYATARNAAPQPHSLTGDTQSNNAAMAGGNSPFTGHGNDHAQQVAQANAARNQAVDALNNYTNSSQSNLGGYTAPAAPPAIGLNPQPSGPSTGTSTAGYPGPSSPGMPVVGGGGGGGGTGTLPPSLPGTPMGGGGGVPVTGTGPVTGIPTLGTPGGGSVPGGVPGGLGVPGGGSFPVTGVPGGGGSAGGGSIPGMPGGSGGVPGGGSGTGPLAPGPVSGIGPTTGVPTPRAAGGPLSAGTAGFGEDIGEIAAGAAVAGGTAAVGIVGANSKGDQVVKGGQDNEPGGFADDEDDFLPTTTALGEVDEEQAAAARLNAELSATEQAGPGLLEPALGRRDSDADHRNSFGVLDDEFFDDGRMVIPDVLGGSDHRDRADDDDDEQDA